MSSLRRIRRERERAMFGTVVRSVPVSGRRVVRIAHRGREDRLAEYIEAHTGADPFVYKWQRGR